MRLLAAGEHWRTPELALFQCSECGRVYSKPDDELPDDAERTCSLCAIGGWGCCGAGGLWMAHTPSRRRTDQEEHDAAYHGDRIANGDWWL